MTTTTATATATTPKITEEGHKAALQIPEHLAGALQRYIEHRYQPGHFLTAVLCNDLTGAILRGDLTSLRALPDIVRWLYNHAPGYCWGSTQRVADYLAGK